MTESTSPIKNDIMSKLKEQLKIKFDNIDTDDPKIYDHCISLPDIKYTELQTKLEILDKKIEKQNELLKLAKSDIDYVNKIIYTASKLNDSIFYELGSMIEDGNDNLNCGKSYKADMNRYISNAVSAIDNFKLEADNWIEIITMEYDKYSNNIKMLNEKHQLKIDKFNKFKKSYFDILISIIKTSKDIT